MCKNRVLRELDSFNKCIGVLGVYSAVLLLTMWVFPDFYKSYNNIVCNVLYGIIGWSLGAFITTLNYFIKDVITYINKDNNEKVKCNELES